MTETDADPTPPLREATRMEPDQIKWTIEELVKGNIVVASALPPRMVPSVFMIVALGGLSGLDLDSVGNVIEHIDKAGPMAVNGYPTFLSCQVVHKDDWAVIIERAQAAHKALREAIDGV